MTYQELDPDKLLEEFLEELEQEELDPDKLMEEALDRKGLDLEALLHTLDSIFESFQNLDSVPEIVVDEWAWTHMQIVLKRIREEEDDE